MQYYGTRLSENISRRDPEGYLLCLNVPVARTGVQEYLPAELGLPVCDESGLNVDQSKAPRTIPVLRPEDEVFSPETVASFEGMPVTNDHPPAGVDAENIRRLQMGHAHNVRRGAGAESDLLLADLIITDPRLIDAILGGKREISCGYTYELCLEDGRYIQRRIRGNHIAVVDAGRAGWRVSIRDRRPSPSDPTQPERRNTSMKKPICRLLARMARDGDIETVAEFIEEMVSEAAAENAEPAAEPAAVAVAVAEPDGEEKETSPLADEDPMALVLEKLDRLIALLSPAPAGDEAVPENETPEAAAISEVLEEVLETAAENVSPAVEEILDPEISSVVGEILEPGISSVLSPESDDEEDCGAAERACSADTLRAVLLPFRPVLAKLPAKERRRICGDIAARLRGRKPASDSGVYAALASARRPAAADPAALGRRIMEKRNPNYKK